jgi:hypothetical protein
MAGGSFMTPIPKAQRRSEQIKRLRAESEAVSASLPMASRASYDPECREVIVEFSNGAKFIFPADQGQGLQGASDENLSKIDIFPSGTGLRWPELDVDLSIPHLMEGIFGTKLWMKEMTAKGGRSTSAAKKAASRVNGKKGGRPKKEE